jgi:hypothetical protein
VFTLACLSKPNYTYSRSAYRLASPKALQKSSDHGDPAYYGTYYVLPTSDEAERSTVVGRM